MNGYYCLVSMAVLMLSLIDDDKESDHKVVSSRILTFWICPVSLFVAWNIVLNTMDNSRVLQFIWDCTWTFMVIFAILKCIYMEDCTFKGLSSTILVVLGAKLAVNLF